MRERTKAIILTSVAAWLSAAGVGFCAAAGVVGGAVACSLGVLFYGGMAIGFGIQDDEIWKKKDRDRADKLRAKAERLQAKVGLRD